MKDGNRMERIYVKRVYCLENRAIKEMFLKKREKLNCVIHVKKGNPKEDYA